MPMTTAQIMRQARRVHPTDRARPDDDGAKAVKHRPLNTVSRCREEMARIYRSVRDGSLPLEDATRLIYILGKIVSAIKAAQESDDIDGELARTPFRGIILSQSTANSEVSDNRLSETEEDGRNS
jgi:hypothetical protein